MSKEAEKKDVEMKEAADAPKKAEEEKKEEVYDPFFGKIDSYFHGERV
jgi:hypothetical protein